MTSSSARTAPSTYACTSLYGTLVAIGQPWDGRIGTSVVVEGSPTELTVAGDTAVAFGRGESGLNQDERFGKVWTGSTTSTQNGLCV